jgi:signal transduction histidine kinase
MQITRRSPRPLWLRYGAAVLVTGAALALKLLLTPIVSRDEPALLFFAAVIVSAVFGGLGPGLLATLISAACDGYFFMQPFGRWALATVAEQWRLGVFIAEGVFISLICARMQSARQSAEASAAEARELEGRLLETSEAEQRRIGHDLHDGLGQHLTGIALMTRRLQRRLASAGSADESNEAAKICELANTAVGWTHDLSRSLSPPNLASAGLPSALAELAAHSESLFHIHCGFECVGNSFDRLDVGVAVHLYRIAQEAVTNAARHGHAQQVRIRLETTNLDTQLSLQIIDDGTGIQQTAELGDGMGLRIMRYRAKMIGAAIELDHPPTGGTVITCRYRLLAFASGRAQEPKTNGIATSSRKGPLAGQRPREGAAG